MKTYNASSHLATTLSGTWWQIFKSQRRYYDNSNLLKTGALFSLTA